MESYKKYLIILAIIIPLVIVATLAFTNFAGIGDQLKGAGGPFAAGLYNVAVGPLNWALGGGFPTLALFYLLGLVVLPFSVAYIIWHYDVPYKIQGATAPSPTSAYTNTMSREPPEPERAPTA